MNSVNWPSSEKCYDLEVYLCLYYVGWWPTASFSCLLCNKDIKLCFGYLLCNKDKHNYASIAWSLASIACVKQGILVTYFNCLCYNKMSWSHASVVCFVAKYPGPMLQLSVVLAPCFSCLFCNTKSWSHASIVCFVTKYPGPMLQ